MYRLFWTVLAVAALMTSFTSPALADDDYDFYVLDTVSYTDVAQDAKGEARAIIRFSMKTEVHGLTFVDMFFSGSDAKGRMYEDRKNKRLLVHRPFTDYNVFLHYQSESLKVPVNGQWSVAKDGTVTKFSMQIERTMASKAAEIPPP